MDATAGVQYLGEIKDHAVSGHHNSNAAADDDDEPIADNDVKWRRTISLCMQPSSGVRKKARWLRFQCVVCDVVSWM